MCGARRHARLPLLFGSFIGFRGNGSLLAGRNRSGAVRIVLFQHRRQVNRLVEPEHLVADSAGNVVGIAGVDFLVTRVQDDGNMLALGKLCTSFMIS